MRELDPQDQAIEVSAYDDPEVAQQHEDGLLSRWEADFNDILAAKGVALPVGSSSDGAGQSTFHSGQVLQVLISQIYIRCQWSDVPSLRQWITQFLAGRQPDATVIAVGMAKQGMTKIALDEQQGIEGYLVIGSAEQELHGSVAEYVAEHLVMEGMISGYAVYSVPISV